MKTMFFFKIVCLINFLNFTTTLCSIYNGPKNNYGYRLYPGQSHTNGIVIKNNGDFGFYGVEPIYMKNNNIIENNGEGGFLAYDSKGLISNEKSGIIKNQGYNGFYTRNCQNMKNYGIIENNGNSGMFVDSHSFGENFGIIKNTKDNGVYTYQSHFINTKNGIVKNDGSFGIYISKGSFGENYGVIKNKENYGAVSTASSFLINHKGGIINNTKNYGIYAGISSKVINNGLINNNGIYGVYSDFSNIINNGIIKNNNNYGFYVTDKGEGSNNGLINNNGEYGVYCDDNGTFTNNIKGIISNTKDIGMYIGSSSTGINNGTIENNGEYGVKLHNSTFINNGTINNNGKISIYMNGNLSSLTLEPYSDIHGIVKASSNINNATINLKNTNNSINPNGKINFQLNNFSTINVLSGNWNISKDVNLISPNLIKSNFFHKAISNCNGTLIINPGINITISSIYNLRSNATISTGSFINNGTIIGKPQDITYVTNKKEVLIPAIFTKGKNNKIGQVKIENLPIGWNGSYIYKNNNLYFKLDKFTSNPNSLLGGYKTTIEKYPLNNLPYLDTLNFRNKIYSWNKNNVNKDSNYFQLLGGYGNNNNTNPKYDYYSYGFLGNIINSYNKYIHYSLGYGYLNNKINYKNSNSSNENIDNVFISTSQTYSNKYFATLQESLTYSHHNLNRYIIDRDKNNSKELLSSNFNQFILTLGGETGYKFKINNNNNFYPYIAFNNYFIDNENYSEQGDSYALHLNNQNYSYPVLKTGFKLSHSYTGYNLVENFYYNYACNNRKHRDAYFKFNNKVIYYLQPINQNKSGIGLSLSLEKHIKKNITLDVGIASNFSEKSIDLTGGLQLTYLF